MDFIFLMIRIYLAWHGLVSVGAAFIYTSPFFIIPAIFGTDKTGIIGAVLFSWILARALFRKLSPETALEGGALVVCYMLQTAVEAKSFPHLIFTPMGTWAATQLFCSVCHLLVIWKACKSGTPKNICNGSDEH